MCTHVLVPVLPREFIALYFQECENTRVRPGSGSQGHSTFRWVLARKLLEIHQAELCFRLMREQMYQNTIFPARAFFLREAFSL